MHVWVQRGIHGEYPHTGRYEDPRRGSRPHDDLDLDLMRSDLDPRVMI